MNGMYGTVKPADIDINNDVEIFYSYRPDYTAGNSEMYDFIKIDNPASVLFKTKAGGQGGEDCISGLFNVKLPFDRFGEKGLYTIYIKPREIKAAISDVSVLAAYPAVRGVAFSIDSNGEMSAFRKPNALSGYRIEYMDRGRKTGDFTLVTSSNVAEVIPFPLMNTSQKNSGYRYVSTGGYLFCTVTPSLSSSFNPNSLPFIGNPGQEVRIVNTKFNPVMLEIKMVEHDDETITTMIEGSQIRNLDHGLITTYNRNNEIYHQAEYYTLKDDYGRPLYDVKEKKNIPDSSENFKNITK